MDNFDRQSIQLALAAINLLTFFMYWHDKRCARNGSWRVPEAMLLGLALAGGSPAAYIAMRALRHKTKKSSFRLRYWLVVIVQGVAVAYWLSPPMPTDSPLQ